MAALLFCILMGLSDSGGALDTLPASEPDTSRIATGPAPTSRHTVRVGGAYQPGPGARLLLFYRYAGFPSGFLTVEGGWAEEVFGAVGYTHTWRPGIWPARQWSLSGTIFSDFTPDRRLDAVETDERRIGGSLRLERASTSAAGSLRLHAEVQHARVHLYRADTPDRSFDLTTLDLGTQWTRTGQFRLPIPALLIGGRLRGGWDHAERQAFVTGRAGGRLFRPLGSGFAAVLDGQAQWSSPATPLVEQAAFGGLNSVRGYRMDTALGRGLWTLQHELWGPVPGTVGAPDGIAGRLNRRVRLAAFVDVGGIAQPAAASDAAVRAGAGLGVRVLLGPLTLRADWGHRLPDVLDGRFAGDLFLSLRPNLSLGLQ